MDLIILPRVSPAEMTSIIKRRFQMRCMELGGPIVRQATGDVWRLLLLSSLTKRRPGKHCACVLMHKKRTQPMTSRKCSSELPNALLFAPVKWNPQNVPLRYQWYKTPSSTHAPLTSKQTFIPQSLSASYSSWLTPQCFYLSQNVLSLCLDSKLSGLSALTLTLKFSEKGCFLVFRSVGNHNRAAFNISCIHH